MTTSLRASALLLLFLVPSTCKAVEPYPGQDEMEKLGRAMAEKLAALGGGPIAIAPMGNQNFERTPLGTFLEPDFLRSFKDSRPGLKVVSQSMYGKILQHHKFEETGLVSPEKLSRLGKFLSTRILVNVVVVPLSDSFLVRALASDTQTAEFLASADAVLPRSDALVSRLSAKERRALQPRAKPQDAKPTAKILYELLECKRTARTVTCAMDLTSLKTDQRVRLSKDTYAIDSQGEHHRATRLNTGKQIGWKLLLKGIPAHVQIEFGNIPKEVELFRTLKLEGKELDAKFSQVRISG